VFLIATRKCCPWNPASHNYYPKMLIQWIQLDALTIAKLLFSVSTMLTLGLIIHSLGPLCSIHNQTQENEIIKWISLLNSCFCWLFVQVSPSQGPYLLNLTVAYTLPKWALFALTPTWPALCLPSNVGSDQTIQEKPNSGKREFQ
jgi:hypothetical protein